MQIRKLLADDDAVSPVIGVILMVAITVILAAVIGTFVLGLGDEVSQETPQSSLSIEAVDGGADQIEITINNGDSIDPSQLEIIVDGTLDDNDTWGPDATEFGPGESRTYTMASANNDAGDDEIIVRYGPSGQSIGSATVDVAT